LSIAGEQGGYTGLDGIGGRRKTSFFLFDPAGV
jgi:hypothetical protein